MSVSEPPPKKVRTVDDFLWVKVKGPSRARKVAKEGLLDVDSLLAQVKHEYPNSLGAVDAASLMLFASEADFNKNGKAIVPNQVLFAFACMKLT